MKCNKIQIYITSVSNAESRWIFNVQVEATNLESAEIVKGRLEIVKKSSKK